MYANMCVQTLYHFISIKKFLKRNLANVRMPQ